MSYRHPDELCDNGCYECRDVLNGGELHTFDIDAGGFMRVIEYQDAYVVAVFGPDNKDGRLRLGSESDQHYFIEKESWKLMLAEEAHEYRQYRARKGRY